jgi:hypothetical protein
VNGPIVPVFPALGHPLCTKVRRTRRVRRGLLEAMVCAILVKDPGRGSKLSREAGTQGIATHDASRHSGGRRRATCPNKPRPFPSKKSPKNVCLARVHVDRLAVLSEKDSSLHGQGSSVEIETAGMLHPYSGQSYRLHGQGSSVESRNSCICRSPLLIDFALSNTCTLTIT